MSASNQGAGSSVQGVGSSVQEAGSRAVLCIFAKPPVPGVCKTRLASSIGDAAAARLAAAFLRDAASRCAELEGTRTIVATTGALGPAFDDLVAWDQAAGDLGARLERVLRRALAEAPKAVACGADSPGLPRRHLEAALRALDSADAVLGRALDGGFTLLGLRNCPEGLLADLPWSQEDTLERTRQRLVDHGFTVDVVDPWLDVDRPEDLVHLRALLADPDVVAPETRRVLALLDDAGPDSLSIVVPTWNEAARIGDQLERLGDTPGVHEVIVVDGGSNDGTLDIARSHRGALLLGAPRGRASQMNTGAAHALGQVLLFLHADVELPRDAASHIRTTLAEPGVVAGAFRTWTHADGVPPWWAPMLHFADLRSRYTQLPYGDQALFLRKQQFEAVGGFPELPILEDLELSVRLGRLGRVHTCGASVRVSGRRFLVNPWRYGFLATVIPSLARLGVPLERIAATWDAVR